MEYGQIKYMLAEYIRQLYTLTDLVCKLQQCKLGYRSSELSRKPADLILTQILLGLISVPCIRQILHLQKAGFLHSCFVRFVSAMHRLVPCESLVSGMDYEIFLWCPEPESNRHAHYRRGILSPLCLPISPSGPSIH